MVGKIDLAVRGHAVGELGARAQTHLAPVHLAEVLAAAVRGTLVGTSPDRDLAERPTRRVAR